MTDNEVAERLDAFLGNCDSCVFLTRAGKPLCLCDKDWAQPGDYWWPKNAHFIARAAGPVDDDHRLVAESKPCHGYRRAKT